MGRRVACHVCPARSTNASLGSQDSPGARMRRFASTACLSLLVVPLAPAPVLADAEADKSAIAARLLDWTEAFNARDASKTCDLFSAELVSTMRDRPDEGHDAVCSRIAAALADRNLAMRYTPKIEEIIVSGDLAVVRIVWSVT